MIEPKNALAGGMPFYKFIGNRVLTAIQNYLLKTKLSEFHSGYRIYAVSALKDLPFERNSNGFHFDTEIIIQLVIARKRIREIAIPTYYGDEISRVNGLNYAKSVVKACLQARLQRIHLFYDRRFDCSPPSQEQRVYPSLDFDRDASRVLNLIPPGSRVLNLGSAMTSLCVALREQKGCVVVSRDPVETALARPQNDLIHSDLALGIADHDNQKFDYILALDLIGKLRAPEEFLDLLRAAAARNGARVILTAANVGFLPMRLSLLVGRFEYSKRGILDLRHTRLFTLKTLRRAMRAAGFDIERIEGVVVPFHLVFGSSFLAGASLAINRALARLWPALFGFELLCIGKAHPTLETLLRAAETTATQKMPAVLLRMSRSRKFD